MNNSSIILNGAAEETKAERLSHVTVESTNFISMRSDKTRILVKFLELNSMEWGSFVIVVRQTVRVLQVVQLIFFSFIVFICDSILLPTFQKQKTHTTKETKLLTRSRNCEINWNSAAYVCVCVSVIFSEVVRARGEHKNSTNVALTFCWFKIPPPPTPSPPSQRSSLIETSASEASKHAIKPG